MTDLLLPLRPRSAARLSSKRQRRNGSTSPRSAASTAYSEYMHNSAPTSSTPPSDASRRGATRGDAAWWCRATWHAAHLYATVNSCEACHVLKEQHSGQVTTSLLWSTVRKTVFWCSTRIIVPLLSPHLLILTYPPRSSNHLLHFQNFRVTSQQNNLTKAHHLLLNTCFSAFSGWLGKGYSKSRYNINKSAPSIWMSLRVLESSYNLESEENIRIANWSKMLLLQRFLTLEYLLRNWVNLFSM